MSETTHFRIEAGESGLLSLIIDVQGHDANVLSADVLEEMKLILRRIETERPKGVAIMSAKPSGFIAGADVKEFTTIKNFDDAFTLIRRGQEVMDQIEGLSCPTVAVINGFCLGGGLELALACNYRIALDDPKTRIGLPEIKLGIHPGFGGSVRSIRLLGPIGAMNLMLSGRTVAAQQARKMGLIDYAVPQRLLLQAAERVLLEKAKPKQASIWFRALNLAPVRSLIAWQMVKQVAKLANKDHYPAPYALIELWRKYGGNPDTMMVEEAHSVASLSNNATARNLVRVFLLQDRLKSLADKSKIEPRHVHVIGAGVMGGDIAAWCALRGFAVTLQDTRKDGLAKALQRAQVMFSKRFRNKAHLVNAAMDRLVPDDKGFGVSKADVLIEAIFEDVDAKQSLYKELEPKLKTGALLVTNTSSIRLETLAEVLHEPGRLVGLHFFNPVAKMPLVEVVKSGSTHQDVMEKALAFARHIDKLPVTVRSSPGFLVNRVLMPYLVEAIEMLDEGISESVIDKAAKDFGMPMGPIRLADSVGLDVCLFVAGILAADFDFSVPDRLRKMVEQGYLGVKSGRGFYEYKKGKPVRVKEVCYAGDLADLQGRLVKRLTDESASLFARKKLSMIVIYLMRELYLAPVSRHSWAAPCIT